MQHPRKLRQLTRFFFWLLAAASLTACSLLAERQFGDQTALEGEVVITCSEACANRTQCGDSVDRGRYVFAGQAGPAVSEHDTILPVDTRATLLEPARQVTLEQVADGERLQIFFYHVALTDDTQQGWVAGWCVATP